MRIGLHVSVLMLSMACDGGEAERQRQVIAEQVKAGIDEAERSKEAAAAKALSDEKARLQSQPSTFVTASDLTYFDKGIVNDYREVVEARLTNKSRFDVSAVSGRVDWLDESGQLVGSSPVRFTGHVPAGQTVLFSKEQGTLTSGTIQGAGSKARVEITELIVSE